MSMQYYSAVGYGAKLPSTNNLNPDNLLAILERCPNAKETFRNDCESSLEGIGDYDDNNEGEGTFLTEIAKEFTGLYLEHAISDDGDVFLLYPPYYDWEKHTNVSKEYVTETLDNFLFALTGTHPDIDYQDVVNWG